MEGGEISGNTVTSDSKINDGGVVQIDYKGGQAGTFIMKGGTIYGSSGNQANTSANKSALFVQNGAIAQYGKQAPFTAFGSILTEKRGDVVVFDARENWTWRYGAGISQTLSVDTKTGVLTVTLK
jgi:hypothetical protein